MNTNARAPIDCWESEREIFGDYLLLHQLRKEGAEHQYHETEDEDGNGGTTAAFPLLEDDAPYVAEGDVERHQDAEGEGHHRG